MNHPFMHLLLRWSILALGVTIATKVVRGISCDEPTTLLVVVLVLSFLNAILKPLLVVFTLPFILITLGFGIVLINAFLFMLVGHLVAGFEVASFWSALGGALVVSVTNLVASSLLGGKGPGGGWRPPLTQRGRRGGGDVIDV
jgi:putative membrane protein